jgi:hypothetical protein
MAFPAIRARNKGSQNSDSTSHSIVLPPSILAGDVLLCFFSCDANPGVSTSSTGWQVLGSMSSGNDCKQTVLWKRATGSDGCVVNTSSAEQSTHASMSVANGTDPLIAMDWGASSPWVDAPRLDPSYGATDYLCIEAITTDSSQSTSQSVTGIPAGFGNLDSRNPTSTQSAATFTLDRTVSGASFLDPAYATIATPEQWVATTVGIAFEQHGGSISTNFTQPVIRSASSGWVTYDYFGPNPPLVFNVPPGIQQGDLLLAWLVADADVTPFSALSWDRADVTYNIDGTGYGVREAQCKLFRRIATADDANQSTFTFQRGDNGDVGVHVTCFRAGTFNVSSPIDTPWYIVFTSKVNNPYIPGVDTVNQGILMGWMGASTDGVKKTFSANSGMTFIGREASAYVSLAAYWQYPPSTGTTSPYYIGLSGTNTATSLASMVRPYGSPTYLRTGRGAAHGAAKGAKAKGFAYLKTGRATAQGAGGGGWYLGKQVTPETARGVAGGAGRGARATGRAAALVTTGGYLTAASGTSAAVPVPPGVTAGQIVMVALWLAAPAATVITKPGPFAELLFPPETTGVVCSTRVFWTAASGADTGTYTFSWPTPVLYEGVALLLDRTVTLAGTPFDSNSRSSTDAAAVGTTPTVSGTASAIDRLALWIGGASSATDWTVPPGQRAVTPTSGARLAVGTNNLPAAGPTGPITGKAATGWGIGWGDAWGI